MSLDAFIDQFGGWTEKYLFYDGQVELRYDPKQHVYLLVSGDGLEPQDGVTSVCHVIDKSDALIPWGCKMMANKLLATAPSMTLPIGSKLVPQMEWAEFEKLVLDAKSAHKEKLEEAATVGSIAHNWIEQYIKSKLACTDDWQYMPYPQDERAHNCVAAALDWMAKHKVRWLSTERKIYSREYKYAGTMDGLALVSSCDDPMCCEYRFFDHLSVIDWKSSNYLYLEYLYQTAAYENAYEEETGEDVLDRWIIRLGKDDGKFDPWHCIAVDFDADLHGFLTCLQLVRSVKASKERIKQRADKIKLEHKLRAKAAKEAALKLKCKNADKYKGTRKPTCNDGNPCVACVAKYAETHVQL